MIAILVWLGFAEYAGAHRLCQEHIAGTPMHIEWASYASADEPSKVIAFYEKSLGKKASPGDHGSSRFELDKDTKLAIFSTAQAEAFPSCETKPVASDKTVILVSKAIR